ncbi:MAG TPA: ATP-binding protein [Flavobacterium sp.]|nr:ATP-binding protein [Flavobacterium sp.]
MHTEQRLKIKLTLGYILLIGIFSLSILYILREVKTLNISKEEIVTENTKVILLSSLISDLYTVENSGRLALVSHSAKDVTQYHQQLDSLIGTINHLKANSIQDQILKNKLDTIIDLIQLKRLTFDQVRDVQQKYQQSDVFIQAQTEIKRIQTSDNAIAIDTVVEKVGWLEKIVTKREIQQKQRLQEENQKIIAKQKEYLDSLNKATESILTEARKVDNKLLRDYYQKEALFIKRNKELSQQLETLLLEVEKIILKNSDITYQTSKAIVDNVSNNIAKAGIVLSVIALIFGFVILRDLNKSSRYKKKLEELNTSMEDLVQQKSLLMASISHDMVSPLNSLMGFSTLLKNSLRTHKQKEYLDNIEVSTHYIKNMVDDLSLFSNLEYNKIKIKKERMNFKVLLNNILNNLRSNAQRKGIQLLTEIDENLNQDFYSDAYRIQQILTNVISNALKFTHKGNVTVKAKYSNNIVFIEVIDTGIGIKTKNKKEIFGEFVQVHDTNETIYGGSGLGLNITKRLIDLLYGTISYESEPNKGTTFFIEIPIQPFENKITENNEEVEYDNEKKLQNKRILVIDDDPLQLKLIREIFGSKVKKLTTIENGALAKEILKQETYHLIVTDMQMPHYSGLKVIKDIRSLKEYEQTPVIALTGKIDYDETEYQNLGFNLYMKKPLNINTLYNTIYKLLRIKPKNVGPVSKTVAANLKYPHFDLTELYTLLDNDEEAVKEILKSFIENARQDIGRLYIALEHKKTAELKNIAHKMLPMFRQLKMTEAVNHLQTLERTAETLSIETLSLTVKNVSEKTEEFLKELERVIN